MIKNSHIMFKSTVAAIGEGIQIFPSESSSTLEIQVEGTATTVTGVWEARISIESPWVQVGAFNYSNNVLKPQFGKGIFSLPTAAFVEVRANVSAVAGGECLIIAKVVS